MVMYDDEFEAKENNLYPRIKLNHNISNGYNIVPVLQRCVANLPV